MIHRMTLANDHNSSKKSFLFFFFSEKIITNKYHNKLCLSQYFQIIHDICHSDDKEHIVLHGKHYENCQENAIIGNHHKIFNVLPFWFIYAIDMMRSTIGGSWTQNLLTSKNKLINFNQRCVHQLDGWIVKFVGDFWSTVHQWWGMSFERFISTDHRLHMCGH